MIIKVLGTGCPNCRNLEKSTIRAISELKIEAEVVKVDDITKIISYGILHTPALVIDENVVLSGNVPSVDEIKEIIQNALPNN